MINAHAADMKDKIQPRTIMSWQKNKINFKKAVKKYLTPILEEMKTEPKLSATICDIIFCWRNKRTVIHTNYSTLFEICAAVKEQNRGLGWTNFVLGRWSPKWQMVRQKYLTSIRSRKSSLRWAVAVIHKLLMTVWNVWDFRNNINKGKNGPEYLLKNGTCVIRLMKSTIKVLQLFFQWIKCGPFIINIVLGPKL